MSKHYHFIGIGGIGVGALASLSLDKGFCVSGSDLRSNRITDSLKARGAEIFKGHSSRNIWGADRVIFSSAIDSNNPELVEAIKRQVPIMRRAKLLAELMEGYTGITVAGAHGKTTTTSMIAHLLTMAGLQPTTAIGGIINGTAGAGARLGEGKYFVTEVDESDGSFLYFSPQYSVITNIDFEHVDYYHSWQDVLDIYRRFIEKTVEGATILICGDDQRLLNLVKESRRPFQTYGLSSRNNIYAENVTFHHFESRFDVVIGGKNRGQVVLNVPGRHNVANALACIALGLNLSIDFQVICDSLKKYKGAQRRFQLKGNINGIWVIDDYAHHPTEIKATLETTRQFKESLGYISQDGRDCRLITVFQPHRYSRVAGLMDEFARSFIDSDHLVITDIYAASEQPIEGITAEKLCQQVRAVMDKPVDYVIKDEIVDFLMGVVKPKDLVLTLGAGDITCVADDFVAALKKQPSPAMVSKG